MLIASIENESDSISIDLQHIITWLRDISWWCKTHLEVWNCSACAHCRTKIKFKVFLAAVFLAVRWIVLWVDLILCQVLQLKDFIAEHWFVWVASRFIAGFVLFSFSGVYRNKEEPAVQRHFFLRDINGRFCCIRPCQVGLSDVNNQDVPSMITSESKEEMAPE